MKTLIFVFLIAGTLSLACNSAPEATTDSPPIVTAAGISELEPAEALPGTNAAYSQFIDVRMPEEYFSGHAYRARNIPLDTLAENLDKLEKNEPVYVICQTSNRSREAAKILDANGFKQVIVVKGGTDRWKAEGLPMANGASASEGDIDQKSRDALLAALDDERRSEALYQAMNDRFGGARPFSNIVQAEKRHQERLIPLLEKYGVQTPKNPYSPNTMEFPSTRGEACRTGVESENKNIAMYEGFLAFVKERDIIEAFKYLQAASRDNHLQAFTRCAEGGGMGRGPGRRGGGGPPNN